ncbi:hypothetical protein PUN28_001983 [Cardiocondyla obscurior]|uniref:Uncharacterized protein n=1 Tax=Cardiocondyla obscurior TaxID=286306 RepID=A0AAW2GS62_9HYME
MSTKYTRAIKSNECFNALKPFAIKIRVFKKFNVFPNDTFQRVLKIVNISRHLYEANSISDAFDKTILKRTAVSHN